MTGAVEDRDALRELVESYALAADRHDGAAAAALFAPDGRLVVWLDPHQDRPTGMRVGREEIAVTIDGLSRYRATHHSISAMSASVDGDHATAETTCVAHHVVVDSDPPHDHVMFIRYRDAFVRTDGRWRFESRELKVQWTATLPVTP